MDSNKRIRKKPYNRRVKRYFNDLDNGVFDNDVEYSLFGTLNKDSYNEDEYFVVDFNEKRTPSKDEYKDKQITKKKKSKKRKKKVNVGVLFVILLLFLIMVGIFFYLFVPYIELNGKSKIVINYKEKYEDMGYIARVSGKDISSLVKVSGSVDTNKLGEYRIIYKLKKGIFTIRKTRKVVVSDIEKPSIELFGGKTYYVCDNKEFIEPGYQVLDNYDKGLRNKVKVTKEGNIYTYTVEDRSGNKKSVKRKVIYGDIEGPIFSYGSTEDLYLSVGDSYLHSSVTANDNCDGDLSSNIKVEGSVDTSNVGKYEVNYAISDSYGNKSNLKRVIHVLKKGAPGTIYLTFDDGPKEGTTNVILDILKEEGVKATFFVTNTGPDNLIVRAYNEGHTIALHTSTHDYSYLYSSSDNYFKDLYSVQDRVYRLTGEKSMIIRFPGGSSNTISRRYSEGIMSHLTKEVLNRGFKYYDWNISSGDAGEVYDSEGVYNTVVKNLSHKKINMVLMHDIKPYTRDALRNIIKYAKENGYTFAAIDNDTQMVRQKVNN